MQQTGAGRRLPTDQHGQSAINNRPSKNTAGIPATYTSGHCEVGGHGRCAGDYRTAVCGCGCHTAPPPLLRIVTVRCVFACGAVVESADPWTAHEGMEGHYRAAHAADIARWAS